MDLMARFVQLICSLSIVIAVDLRAGVRQKSPDPRKKLWRFSKAMRHASRMDKLNWATLPSLSLIVAVQGSRVICKFKFLLRLTVLDRVDICHNAPVDLVAYQLASR